MPRLPKHEDARVAHLSTSTRVVIHKRGVIFLHQGTNFTIDDREAALFVEAYRAYERQRAPAS